MLLSFAALFCRNAACLWSHYFVAESMSRDLFVDCCFGSKFVCYVLFRVVQSSVRVPFRVLSPRFCVLVIVEFC